jgi:ankyrin repeat protein
VNAQDYDRGKNKTILLFNLISFCLVLDLLQSGVDPRTADKYGRTPLHVASTKLDAPIGKS